MRAAEHGLLPPGVEGGFRHRQCLHPDGLPRRFARWQEPFFYCNREEDYRRVWKFFNEKQSISSSCYGTCTTCTYERLNSVIICFVSLRGKDYSALNTSRSVRAVQSGPAGRGFLKPPDFPFNPLQKIKAPEFFAPAPVFCFDLARQLPRVSPLL